MAERAPKASHEAANAYERRESSHEPEQSQDRPEMAPERSRAVSPETIKHLQQKAESEARSVQEQEPKSQTESAPPQTLFGVLDTHSERTTLERLRQQLPTYDRVFSRIVHAEPVERISEVAGVTIARPSGVLGAGLTALLGLVFVVWIAKRTGFALSGGEFFVLLIIGWVLGVTGEFGYRLVQRMLHSQK